MLPDDPNLDARYRMPRVFGALPGPRNVPKDKRGLPNQQTNLVLSVSVRTDAALLAKLLPPDCEIDGEPLLEISLHEMSHIGWLAGHGYSILAVSIAMTHGSRRGEFIPVLWENLADPIITGREELGWPKLYADIPPVSSVANQYRAAALWRGFRFFEIELSELRDAVLPASSPRGQFHYKYIPRTGALGEADLEYLGYSASGAAGYAPLRPVSRLAGKGSFRFFPARWEDMPFQYPIVNFLAALPVLEVVEAGVTRLAAGPPGPSVE